MEIFEKIFQKVWDYKKGVSHHSQTQDLNSIKKTISVFSSGILKPSFEPQVFSSDHFIGIQGRSLFLPKEISLLDSHQDNRNLYLNLVLQSCMAFNLGIKKNARSTKIKDRLFFLEKMNYINTALDQEFPGYLPFQSQLYAKVLQKTQKQLKSQFQDLQRIWSENYLNRETITDKFIQNDRLNFKKNEILPSFLFLMLPCLPQIDVSDSQASVSRQQKKQEESKKQKTEVEKENMSPPETVELEKEKANPVTHSFEKMNTADEHEGGRRMDSGDDELEAHARALEELNLSKITRDGETAQSVYRAEGLILTGYAEVKIQKTESSSFLYPEWSFQKSIYLSDYCQLYESTFENKKSEIDFLKKIQNTYKYQISNWKRKIQSLFNEPSWVNRQKEGDEIDLDSFVREYISLIKNQNVSGKWYLQRRRLFQELSVFILFDQSMSSDSWVQNHRVIDTILDSIGVVGLLVQEYIHNVSIAGTWSETRHSCHLQYYKKEKDDWNHFWKSAPLVEPRGYTRLGPALRHATRRLAESKTSKKLLLFITDGRPTDLDGYEGLYGILDVKQACREAENQGVLPFALVIEKDYKHHFSKMFNHYKVLNNPVYMAEELFKILTQLLVGKCL